MSFDIYKLLKLKDRSQRLYVVNNPHIYIYGDLILNTKSQKIITLTEPTSISNSLCHQLGAKPGRFVFFEIHDCYGRKIYSESTYQGYCYSVLEFNDDDYLIKTHMTNGYVDWVYDLDEGYVTSKKYDNGNVLQSEVLHAISDIQRIIYLPKTLDTQK